MCSLNCCTYGLVVLGVKRDATTFCTTREIPEFELDVLVVVDRSHGVGGVKGRGVSN